MHARWLSSAFFLIATSCAGFAAPATSDGAKAIEQGYADYFGKAVVDKGIVSVSPDGDDYVVAWDLRRRSIWPARPRARCGSNGSPIR